MRLYFLIVILWIACGVWAYKNIPELKRLNLGDKKIATSEELGITPESCQVPIVQAIEEVMAQIIKHKKLTIKDKDGISYVYELKETLK